MLRSGKADGGVNDPETLLIGIIERITYLNEENGYTVIKLLPDSPLTLWDSVNADGTVTVTGTFPDVIPGETLELHGCWVSHPQHGDQFKADSFKRLAPTTLAGITRYLGSGLIKGVGPKTAEAIVAVFGKDTLTILDQQPHRLREVSGVGEHRVRTISEAWQEQKAIQDVMLFLQSQGVSTSLAVRIYKAYGDKSVDRVRENPYQLANEIQGIGFKTADQIARNLGLQFDDPHRLQAGIIHVLSQAVKDGDVYLPETILLERAAELLACEMTPLQFALEIAVSSSLVIRVRNEEGWAFFLPEYDRAEAGVAHRLLQLLAGVSEPLVSAEKAGEEIRGMHSTADIDLTDTQIEAIISALSHPISIITGGPGTGKTTIIKTVIQILEEQRLSYLLASPTGRAAKRLSEAAGAPASTIHRMLGYSPGRGFDHDAFQPLLADLIIIDEASMIDILLANALLRGIHPASRLLLIGDVDQLPSVGAGDFLRDLIDSGMIPTTRLDVIFRQEADSLIIHNAHLINKGEMPEFPDEARDFFLFKIADDPERAASLIVEVVKKRLPKKFGVDPLTDIQVIVPMYRGEAGIMNLNGELQKALNPERGQGEKIIGGRIFRVGDKVLQTSNDYDKEVFNGDIGRISAIDQEDMKLTIDFDSRPVYYDFTEASDLLHAYAISVHRAQGSEYPVVVMPIITQHYVMLQRNLFYTAITRAKEKVVLIGSLKAISIAVRSDKVAERFSLLKARLYDQS